MCRGVDGYMGVEGGSFRVNKNKMIKSIPKWGQTVIGKSDPIVFSVKMYNNDNTLSEQRRKYPLVR